jgi:hypothetical protein
MYAVVSALLIAVIPVAAHSAPDLCIVPDRAPAIAAEAAKVVGHFGATRQHGATSSSPAAEARYQLWLRPSGEAEVQREVWDVGQYQKRSTGILRGTWSIERGYVVLLYGGYCETLALLKPADSGRQRLKSIHGRTSSAWLLIVPALERAD